MSISINLLQKTRPYKIDVFGLQDNYIGCLQSYKDSFLGQIVEPRMEIKDDGTQTFTCKIPKFYIDETSNQKIINPRWKEVDSGILAENTRVLKVFIQFPNDEIKVFPFIIDKVINKRDNNFSVYKEITGNGLAFAELGKQGYKLELNSSVLEQDYEKDNTVIANINYWLDKVFPNEKDINGHVTKWLTPWCYEIKMDWRGYLDEFQENYIDGGTSENSDNYGIYNGKDASILSENILNKFVQIDAGLSKSFPNSRDSNIIYENPYINSWSVINNKLTPNSVTSFKEKARYIDCINSNKYNITQDIAEAFEVFCIYEYSCDQNGYFKKTYEDESGYVWTGKKVVFFNRAIKTENPYVINYKHNLSTISRTIDSSEVYTKMYVNPIASEIMDTGYVSIADTSLNPLLDDFILNFDYLYKIGSISDVQKNEIENYKISLHKINKEILTKEQTNSDLVAEINKTESLKAAAKAAMESAQEQLTTYEKYMQQLSNEPVIKNKKNPYRLNLVPKNSMGIVQGTFNLEGINIATISGYADSEYSKVLFSQMDTSQNTKKLIPAQNIPSDASTKKNRWYVTTDEYGFPSTIFTSMNNDSFNEENFGKNFDISTGGFIYLELEYFPKNKYETICSSLLNKIEVQRAKMQEYDDILGNNEGNEDTWFGLKKELKINENLLSKLYTKKNNSNFRLERILGPALREGYWQPETYEDPGEGHNVILSTKEDERDNIIDGVKIIFDEELFKDEQKEYYYASSDDIDNEDKRIYYPYIDLTNIINDIGTTIDINGKTRLVSDFSLILLNPEYTWTVINQTSIKQKQEYFVLLDSKYYTFKMPEYSEVNEKGFYPENTKLIIRTIKEPEDNIDYDPPFLKIINTNKTEVNVKMTLKNSRPNLDSAYNLTEVFMGSNQYLSSRHLYNGSGFQFAYFKFVHGNIIPVALLISEDIDYSRYKIVKYSFDKGATIEENTNKKLVISKRTKTSTYKIVYPRIHINYRNVNTKSENLKILVTDNNKKLENYEDYQILERNNRPYITLKVTDKQLPKYIINEKYNIIFQVSRANEKLYLDAEQVAKDSSKPKYSYEIQAATIPDEIISLELGQLCHINDYSIDTYKEHGYISSLSFSLDKPSEDAITISNYKTKFEDLFSSIAAQNEAMKQNRDMYNIAIASFDSNGNVKPSVLQSTLDSEKFSFNFNESNLRLDDHGGLVLTNLQPYQNGVYGQLVLKGDGVFYSSEINDSTGERLWNTAITSTGIKADAITTGKLDTNLIRIMSGDQIAFQWKSDGLYSYKSDIVEGVQKFYNDSYIQFNENGLLYKLKDTTQLKLDWEGLKIKGADGHLQLTSDNGLQILDNNNNIIMTFGRFNDTYGMFFTNGNNEILLQAVQNGKLQLVDILEIGSSDDNNYAGLCGSDQYEDPITKEYIRIWAGSKNPKEAEFTVCEDGAVKATKIFIVNSENTQEYIELNYNNLKNLIK